MCQLEPARCDLGSLVELEPAATKCTRTSPYMLSISQALALFLLEYMLGNIGSIRAPAASGPGALVVAEGAGLAEQQLVREHAKRPQVTCRTTAPPAPLLGRQVAIGTDAREVAAGG